MLRGKNRPMNLDDLSLMKQLDPQNMQAELEGLPDQLAQAWQLGQRLPLPEGGAEGFSLAVVSGMGGSAIGADLLAAYVAPTCRLALMVHRDYGLPAFARGKT